MNLPRRRFLYFVGGVAALPFAPCRAEARAYPSRPVRLLVGFPAGSGGDIIARLIGEWLSERLGQPFVIENRPGAGTNIAAEAAARAAPDGYTLLYVASTNTVNVTLYRDLPFNFIRDIAPVAGFTRLPLIMEVNPSFPATTVPEFIAYAKANPGKINMASAGTGTTLHMAGELFKTMTGVNLLHVPYRGAPQAITDLLGGQVQVIFDLMSSSIAHVKAGRLRALAVTTAARSNSLPDIPAVDESVPGYETISWSGLGAPRSTPKEIIDKLNREINAALVEPKNKARLADIGSEPMPMSVAEFGKLIVNETEKWARVVKLAGLKPE
jgi:tripartite-type tricarboxylate transporter receptor subunit TctC